MPTHLNPQDIEPVKVGPGCYRRDLPTLGADSRHQPRSETGVRLFGFNPL